MICIHGIYRGILKDMISLCKCVNTAIDRADGDGKAMQNQSDEHASEF